MGLFEFKDVEGEEAPRKYPALVDPDIVIDYEQNFGIRSIDGVFRTIDLLEEGKYLYYMTDGAWSNIDIIQKLVEKLGECRVYFCTWSISEEAIRRFVEWQSSGMVKHVHALIDQGFRNRKPQIMQQAIFAFKNLRFSKCHAKVAVVYNDSCSYVLAGSANMTSNPRIEVATLFMDKKLAEMNIGWISKEFTKGE